ncbi:MAG: glycosyltransferase [Patescibacteria group bacterium]|nr:glycosyltransferase [Patescibacteria group bacterium]
MSKKTISVIIPCKNQEDKLPNTFKDIKERSEKDDLDVKVIFVNDRSDDKSPEIADKLGKELPSYKRIDTPKDLVGVGKGRAVKMGMTDADTELELFMDADNSTSFKEVDKLLPYVDKYDIVIGTRYSKSVVEGQNNWFKAVWGGIKDVLDVLIYGHAKRYTATGKQGRLRQLVSRGGNLVFTILLGQSYTDQRCGFKLFTKKASDIIFPKIQLDGFGFDTEIFVIAKKYNLSVIEVPVDWFDDAAESNVGLKDAINTFKEIFQIYGFILRGKYRKKNS